MKSIGLIGGIGSGKSEVSRILGELGAQVINADQVGHEAYLPHTEGWRQVVEAFGRDILQPTEEVDRRKLGSVVFSAPEKLQLLNSILHPLMYKMMEERLDRMRAEGVQVAVLEAAILIEAGWRPLVDEVWCTEAGEEDVVRRVQARSNLPEEQIRSRIHAQLSAEERAKHAQVIVRNDGSLEELQQRVEELWSSRVQERK